MSALAVFINCHEMGCYWLGKIRKKKLISLLVYIQLLLLTYESALNNATHKNRIEGTESSQA